MKQVIGIPAPTLKWFKDSKEIKAGDIFALTASASDPTSLGIYTCEVSTIPFHSNFDYFSLDFNKTIMIGHFFSGLKLHGPSCVIFQGTIYRISLVLFLMRREIMAV